jgi:hypothetical protein
METVVTKRKTAAEKKLEVTEATLGGMVFCNQEQDGVVNSIVINS